MLGAIAGDIIGSVYEGKKGWMSARTSRFEPLFHPKCRFTDDTVLTIAVAESILHGGDLVNLFKDYARAIPGPATGGHSGAGRSRRTASRTRVGAMARR